MSAVWVDVDTGVDDALALTYLVRSGQPLVGVSAVSGNTDVDTVVSNTLAVLAAAGDTTTPVFRGAAKPIIGRAKHASDFHGVDGLAGIAVPRASRTGEPRPALEGLLDAARDHGESLTVIALGPLTNLAHFALAHPEEARSIGRVVVMGGALVGGNASATAEFNFWHDPEAAQIVIEAGLNLVIYPLDVFKDAAISIPEIDDFGESLVAALLRVCADPHRGVATVGDAGAACVAVRPDLAGIERVKVAMELGPGRSRGTLLVDRRHVPGESESHGDGGDWHAVDVVIEDRGIAAEVVRLLA